MRWHNRVVLAALSLSVLAAPLVTSPGAQGQPIDTTAVVLKVVDGDTIDIRDDVRGRLRVRVLGIDTPETKKPGYSIGCWGPEATQFAESTLLGQRVALVIDTTQDRTDRYGRTLAYLVRGDGWDYSVEAARAGAAHSYVYGGVPVSHYEAIQAAEWEAQNAHSGLWGLPCNGNTESVATAPSGTEPSTAPPAATSPAPFVAPPLPAAIPPAPLPAAIPPASPPASAYYANCDAARAAGVAPIRVGQPGYRKGLDNDGDGTACDN
jgi:endonuclease YncB( thermonuclease family)